MIFPRLERLMKSPRQGALDLAYDYDICASTRRFYWRELRVVSIPAYYRRNYFHAEPLASGWVFFVDSPSSDGSDWF